MPNSALAGTLVVALEQAVAVPFATRQLVDLGTGVIKIERPIGGDFARGDDPTIRGLSSHFVWLNRQAPDSAQTRRLVRGGAKAPTALQAVLNRGSKIVFHCRAARSRSGGLAAEVSSPDHLFSCRLRFERTLEKRTCDLTEMIVIELSEHQQMVAKTVRDFVDREVIPVATELKHRNKYRHALVEPSLLFVIGGRHQSTATAHHRPSVSSKIHP
jgi:hypothetical protein